MIVFKVSIQKDKSREIGNGVNYHDNQKHYGKPVFGIIPRFVVSSTTLTNGSWIDGVPGIGVSGTNDISAVYDAFVIGF